MSEIGLVEKMTAACSGSLLTSVVVNPFDVVRVRMQQDSAFASQGAAQGSSTSAKNFGTEPKPITAHPRRIAPQVAPLRPSTLPVPNGLGSVVCCKDVFWYPSTMDYCVASQLIDRCAIKGETPGTFGLLKSISQQEGPLALWRGLSLQLLQSIPSNVVYFVAYEHLRDLSPVQSPVLTPLLAGGFARTFATTVTSPIELFKTRLQSVRGEAAFSIVRKSIAKMVKEDGLKSLWSGLTLTLWRDVPFSMVYWLVVETVRAQYREYKTEYSKTSTTIESVAAGTLGGAVASLLTTPFDVGKTRKQLGHHSSESASMKMIPFMRHIAQQEGVGALFVGLTPRVLKVAPACAIMITSYELSKMAFSERR